jgi:hypothetical protein
MTISKTSSVVCADTEKGGESVARVSYVVTVTNASSESVTLTRVVDDFDDNMSVNWIDRSTISPTGVVTSTGIQWETGGVTLASGESKIYSYTVVVPQTAFRTYLNVATATYDGKTVNASRSTVVSCSPNTGLFDSTQSKIALGIILLFVGVVYVYVEDNAMFTIKLTEKGLSLFTLQGRLNKSREEFESSFEQRTKNRK